jgi:hypothetical protein
MSIATDVRDEIGQAPQRVRRLTPLDGLSIAAVAAPFLVIGIMYGFTGHTIWGGDQALIELDTFDVLHLDQAVGNYSRMGWAHPGPAWLVLLAPVYWAFGSTGEALVAASMVVHGATAALVVLAAGTGARWQRPLMAVVVLLYVLRMPSVDFVAVWNPFALLLPTILLLLVAARACAGSLPALATALVVGSFLVQTHVGTVPLVGAVGLTTLVPLAVRALRRRLPLPDRAGWVRAGLALAVAVLMWVPPLWQQLTAAPGKGNLAMLVHDLLHGDPAEAVPTWRETLSATGQMLGAPVYGWPAEPALFNATILTAAVVAAVVVQFLGSVAVAVVGRRVGATTATWLGTLSAVATVAGLVSVHSVHGLLMNYLVLWISALPAVLLFAGASLVVSWWRTAPQRVLGALAGVLTAVAILAAAGLTVSLHRMAGTLGDHPGAAEGSRLALDALPPAADVAQPVLLDIRDVSTWTTATAVGLHLEEAGYQISVEQTWVYGFGSDRASTGNEEWEVALEPVGPGAAGVAGQVGVVQGQNGPQAIIVQRTR